MCGRHLSLQIYTVLTTAQLYELLEARRLELGLSHMQLGQAAFGREDNSAIPNLRRGSSPTLERLGQICDALGLEVRIEKPRALQGMSEDEADNDFAAKNTGRAGYLPLPWAEPGAGKGSAPVALHVAWLDANRLNPERLSAVIPDVSLVSGYDPARTVAIIEKDAPRRGGNQVWCLRETSRVILARVAWFETGFVIMPARPEEAPRLIRPDDPSAPYPLGRVACVAVVVTP